MWKFRTLTLALSRYAGEGTKLGGGKRLWLRCICHAHEHGFLISFQPIKLHWIVVKNLGDHFRIDLAVVFELCQRQ